MQINNKFNNFLVKADKVLDYVPIVSTVTNLVDIFEKAVLHNAKPATINNNRYYTHIQQKSLLRTILLTIPIFGNIGVGIYDFIKNNRAKKRQEYINKIDANYDLSTKSDAIKNDPEIVLKAVRMNPKNFQFASKELRSSEQFIIDCTIYCSGWKLYDHINTSLKANKTFVISLTDPNFSNVKDPGARKEYKEFIDKISNVFGSDYNFVKELLDYSPRNLEFLDDQYRDDRETVLAAIKSPSAGHWALQYASERLKNDIDVVRPALLKDPELFKIVGEVPRKDRQLISDLLVEKNQNFSWIKYIDKEILADWEFWGEVVKENDTYALYSHLVMYNQNKPLALEFLRRNEGKTDLLKLHDYGDNRIQIYQAMPPELRKDPDIRAAAGI